MKFMAQARSIKADIPKRTITIAFVVELDDQSLAGAEELAIHVDKSPVIITIDPTQLTFAEGSEETNKD